MAKTYCSIKPVCIVIFPGVQYLYEIKYGTFHDQDYLPQVSRPGKLFYVPWIWKTSGFWPHFGLLAAHLRKLTSFSEIF